VGSFPERHNDLLSVGLKPLCSVGIEATIHTSASTKPGDIARHHIGLSLCSFMTVAVASQATQA